MRKILLAVFILFSFPAFAVEVGQVAPALTARGEDGEEFDLYKLRGKVIIVNFWASWCPPCQAEMPILDKFARTHKVEIIGVNTDGELDGWNKKLGYKLFLPAEILENGFGAPRELPTSYIIDAKGIIRGKFTENGVTEKMLEEIIAPMPPAKS